MSTQLKLDSAAVASLFPEGSEARLQLQSAVITETLRFAVAGKLSAALEATVEPLMREATNKVLQEYVEQGNGGYPPRWRLKPEIMSNVKQDIQKYVSEATAAEMDRLHKLYADRAKTLEEHYLKQLDAAIHKLTNDRIEVAVKERVAHVVAAVIDPIMKPQA